MLPQSSLLPALPSSLSECHQAVPSASFIYLLRDRRGHRTMIPLPVPPCFLSPTSFFPWSFQRLYPNLARTKNNLTANFVFHCHQFTDSLLLLMEDWKLQGRSRAVLLVWSREVLARQPDCGLIEEPLIDISVLPHAGFKGGGMARCAGSSPVRHCGLMGSGQGWLCLSEGHIRDHEQWLCEVARPFCCT